ncbi:MAG: hypothetical protein AB1440_10180 [Pseudomonadota bacterium]
MLVIVFLPFQIMLMSAETRLIRLDHGDISNSLAPAARNVPAAARSRP